jgi:hypothetical protein
LFCKIKDAIRNLELGGSDCLAILEERLMQLLQWQLQEDEHNGRQVASNDL